MKNNNKNSADTPKVLDDANKNKMLRLNAEKYLNKDYDYHNSKILFQKLVKKTPSDKDLWLGYLRSITFDFTKKDFTSNELSTIKNVWERYTLLASTAEIKKQQIKIKPILDQINNKKEHKQKNVFKSQLLLKIFLPIIIIVFLIIMIIAFIKPVSVSTTQIAFSEIVNTCNELENCNFTNLIKNTISSKFSKVDINEVKFSLDESKYAVEISLANFLGKKAIIYNYEIFDDLGPIISDKKCSTFENKELDIDNCISIYDLTDGKISIVDASITLPNFPYSIGDNTFHISVSDKDGNNTSKDITFQVNEAPKTNIKKKK